MKALPTGSVIGILGGGQLARMTALAAAPLGYEVHIFSPDKGPATQVTPHHTQAAYSDEAALARFADAVDVVTYEFENVPADTAAFLAARVPVRPGPNALAICQDRLREKTFLREVAGVPTADFWAVNNAIELGQAMAELGGRGVLKTTRGGYDGKGQTFLHADEDPAAVWARVAGERTELALILEAFVPFELEASVVIARGQDGQTAAYDLVENVHQNHILHQTIAPARVAGDVAQRAADIAAAIVAGMDYVGVMGIEFFVLPDGALVVNEMAPRPHNSGHWTQDATHASQFEQVVRASTGLPLGNPTRHHDAVMTNLIGNDVDTLDRWLEDPTAFVHLYGKEEARPGRKMGHVNKLS